MSKPHSVRDYSASVTRLRAALADVRRRRQLLQLMYHGSLLLAALTVLLMALSAVTVWFSPSYPLQWLLSLTFVGVAGLLLLRFARICLRLRADDQQLAGFVEARIPDLEQRLLTSLEFAGDPGRAASSGVSQQFLEQLWEDAETHLAQQHSQLAAVTDSRQPRLALLAAVACAAGLLTVMLSSDSWLRAGGHLVWPFAAAPEAPAESAAELVVVPADIEIVVEPGDLRLQRGRPLSISVRVDHADPDSVRLRMRSDQLNWYDVDLRMEGSGSTSSVYTYYMPAVQDELVYYVAAGTDGEVRSREYRVSLYDLPRAESIDVAYNFPAYTGLENYQESDSGDVVVPEGTELTLQITFNKSVRQAELVLNDDQRLPIDVNGQQGQVTLTALEDSRYYISAEDFDNLQTEEPDLFYIRAIPDEPPTLVLHSPGRDQDVMPLEEVILQVEARDDYGLSEFMLHYSVIGADEVGIDFLPDEQTRTVTGNQMLYLEDMAVQPGDFVSYYMTVADNNDLRGPQQIVSDIYFLQIVPTDQEFRRASGGGQQGGGGGGGDNNSSALVTLQKDIIAATWRLRQQQPNLDTQQFDDDVAIVAQSQRDATERARMSIDRLSERINFADDSYGNAVTYLQRAIEQMNLAAGELDQQALTSAMTPQQQALQFVLRAEAEINRTDVNFQRQAGGGGGGGGQQEREDLRELFEMEMGQNENRYETPRQARGGGQQNSEESSRLEELARRQEGLTRAQRNLARRMEDMTEEQRRRELERLRREQEQISNELAQLQQQMSRRQQMSGQQTSGQQQAGNQSGSPSTMEQMQQALQQMQEAAQAPTPAQAAARSQRALDSLREQQRQLAEQNQAESGNQLAQNLSQRGQQLQQRQQQLQQQLQDLARQQGLGQSRQAAASSEQVQSLLNEQQQLRQEIEELERMLRAVVARAGNDERQLLQQAQSASRSLRPVREQMDTSQRVLRNGMVNLAVDIERDVGTALNELNRQLQGLDPGTQVARNGADNAIEQAAADASALRQQLEALQQQIDNRANGQDSGQAGGQPGETGQESITQLRERLAQSQQLAQQLTQQLAQGQGGEQGRAQTGSQRGQQASRGTEPGSPGSQQAANQPGGSGVETQQLQGLGGIPGEGEAALWGNARSISSEITQQSLEAFMNQPELLRGLLQPLVELESDLRARAELARITRRLYALSDEDIPEAYRQMVEDYYRALSENRSVTP